MALRAERSARTDAGDDQKPDGCEEKNEAQTAHAERIGPGARNLEQCKTLLDRFA